MSSILFFLNLALLLHIIINSYLLRKVTTPTTINYTVDVLIPVRNEEGNIPGLLESLGHQKFVEKLRFIFIDDNSIDGTRNLIKNWSDSRCLLISAPELEKGWLGKPAALHAGYLQSDADVIVTLDADVRLQTSAIAQAVDHLMKSDLDFISPYPRQIAKTFGERLIQPLLQWSWLATVPLRIAERSLYPSLAVANGQFFLVKSHALDAVGGFTSIRDDVLDDLELARNLKRAGFQGNVIDGSEIASTRMYSSLSQIRVGYGKSLWLAFGGLRGTLFVASFLIFTGLYPVYLTFNFDPLGVLALLAIILSRATSAARTHGRISDSILHPFSILFLLYLMIFSFHNKGRVQWKGRSV